MINKHQRERKEIREKNQGVQIGNEKYIGDICAFFAWLCYLRDQREKEEREMNSCWWFSFQNNDKQDVCSL